MTVKKRSEFVCQQCGARFTKWAGRCSSCGAWNSLIEEVVAEDSNTTIEKSAKNGKELSTYNICDDLFDSQSTNCRYETSIADLDNMLGGGILAGSVTLLAGQPGIGKSTILLQIASTVAKKMSVLYVSGEESASQVKMRFERLKKSNVKLNLRLAATTNASDIEKTILSSKFDLVIVDSIQTISLNLLSSAPGTVSQITACGNLIIRAAKTTNTAVMIVGHVTKQGDIAGPKILEHLVDVVLEFEGDRYGGLKILRAVKNRFGPTSEAAIFAMDESGLKLVNNPSKELLSERQNMDGSIVLATLEGNRPLLVEIQALVNKTNFGYPKRAASGFDLNRLNLLIAVLERRTKLKLADSDIYINVVGGIKIQDQAADLAVAMAIASAAAKKKLSDDLVVFGEIGLGGEIRSARLTDRRITESKKVGFKHAIAPDRLHQYAFIEPVANLRDTLNKYLK